MNDSVASPLMTAPELAGPQPIVYPETDGEPIAENTLQFSWIVTIEGGFEALFADNANVFVAGDLFWYPVEGDNTIVQAPDTLVVFGRPKGHRRSYQQWLEGGIAPQVVWEVLSPSNRPTEMDRKFQFYERYGVEEYYIYNPDNGDLFGWVREGTRLRAVASMQGFVSPRLQVRFEVIDGELCLTGPDGRRFASYLELADQREQAERQKAEAERQKAEAEQQKAEAERQKAEAKRQKAEAEQERDQLRRQAEAQAKAAEQLRQQLRDLGAEPKS